MQPSDLQSTLETLAQAVGARLQRRHDHLLYRLQGEQQSVGVYTEGEFFRTPEHEWHFIPDELPLIVSPLCCRPLNEITHPDTLHLDGDGLVCRLLEQALHSGYIPGMNALETACSLSYRHQNVWMCNFRSTRRDLYGLAILDPESHELTLSVYDRSRCVFLLATRPDTPRAMPYPFATDLARCALNHSPARLRPEDIAHLTQRADLDPGETSRLLLKLQCSYYQLQEPELSLARQSLQSAAQSSVPAVRRAAYLTILHLAARQHVPQAQQNEQSTLQQVALQLMPQGL